MDAMGELYRRGVMIEIYDQMIGEGNEAANATVQKGRGQPAQYRPRKMSAPSPLSISAPSSSKAQTASTIRTR
jgi:hypothetical protein